MCLVNDLLSRSLLHARICRRSTELSGAHKRELQREYHLIKHTDKVQRES